MLGAWIDRRLETMDMSRYPETVQGGKVVVALDTVAYSLLTVA